MIAFIADVHVANHRRHGGPMKSGINRRCAQVLGALEVAVGRARRRGCKGLAVLGDLFDTVNPPQQVVAEVQRILGDFPTWVLLGNHEQVSTEPGDHALGPLGPVVTVIEQPTHLRISEEYGLFFVPFRPGPAVEWLPEVLAEWCGGDDPKFVPGPGTAILTHLGISDDSTPAFLRGTHDSVPASLAKGLCDRHGFSAFFAGNWHHHKCLSADPLIVQVGTLAPTGWDNPGVDHGQVVYWDGASYEVEQVPGPRFLKISMRDAFVAPDKECHTYVQIEATADEALGAQEWLARQIDAGVVCAGEVVPKVGEVRAAARKSAIVARSADTLEEALGAYVEEMPLEADVDRKAVLSKARQYLGGQ